jgi:hypothetical protein
METKGITMYNLENPAYLEAKGLSKVWAAYSENCPREDIFEVGFNQNSGYVYIALENGITLASIFGQDVQFLVTDMDNGEEFFLDTIEEAEDKQEEINERYAY